MSRIAQNLCNEIVEPALKPSRDNTATKSSSRYMNPCPSKQDSKTTRSIIIEKRKVINKFIPNNPNASRTKFNSKETLLKKNFADVAVNTLITGSLKCDNDCVTMVRRRDHKCSCKCAHKRLNNKMSAKQIQTFDAKDFLHTDRACAQCIETASCGTQFLEKLNDIKSQVSSGTGTKQFSRDNINIQSKIRDPPRNKQGSTTQSKPFLNFMGARRWALSQYPTRGPDF